MTRNWQPFTKNALDVIRNSLEREYTRLRDIPGVMSNSRRNLITDLLDDIDREKSHR